MNKIHNAFENKKAFIGFLTAGDPTFEDSFNNIMAMVKGGADLIEIGIPFSAPIAEGPVIHDTDIPICFMTYLNPVFKYGYDRFFERCQKIGVDGLICPDMPYEEKHEAADVAQKYGVSIISLIAPTSEDRIKMIASEAEGFIYIVSSMGVTGVRSEIKTDIGHIMEAVKKYAKVPAAVGFGISKPEQAKKMAYLSDGVIVGSAIVKLVAQYGSDAPDHIYEYVKSMKDAIR